MSFSSSPTVKSPRSNVRSHHESTRPRAKRCEGTRPLAVVQLLMEYCRPLGRRHRRLTVVETRAHEERVDPVDFVDCGAEYQGLAVSEPGVFEPRLVDYLEELGGVGWGWVELGGRDIRSRVGSSLDRRCSSLVVNKLVLKCYMLQIK